MATNLASNAPGRPPSPPYGVAVSGVLFSVLYIASLVLIRLSVPADPTESGAWLADPDYRSWSRLALNLVPFAGLAFLWYMAVLRNRIGLLEDQFFGTVFLGSGVLFVAMLFTAAGVAQGLCTFGNGEIPLASSETYRVGRATTFALMITFGTKMSAVFMFATSTIGLRTGVLARWISYVGFAFGLVLLLVIADFAWIALLFPSWAMLVSTWILLVESRQQERLPDREGVI